MSELLDNRTLFLASGIVCGALLMLLELQARKPYPGFVRAAVGLEILSAAIVIGGLKGFTPTALWLIQLTYLGAMGLLGSGIRLFCGMPRRSRWLLFYVVGAILFRTYLFFVQPSDLRIVLIALLLIPVFLDAALPLLRTPPKGREFGYRFAATVFILLCVAACVRIVAVKHFRGNAPYFASNPVDNVFFLLVLFLLLACAFAMIVLTHERLVVDLKDANERCIAESEERVRLEQQLAQSLRLASVGRLAGGIAHFFNNQMHVIQLTSWLLREFLRVPGPPAFNYIIACSFIRQIERASRRSSEIAGRLLQYAQSRVLRTSHFDPTPLLISITPELYIAAGEKIEVTTSTAAKVPQVEVDADRLKEAIFVLVQNAREAMPAGGKLAISLREEQLDLPRAKELGLPPSTFVLLSVGDTGSGMDDETLAHLFEPFFTTKERSNYEGLGLASTYGFLRQSGGTITVRSTPHRGSTFEMYLPTARPHEAQQD